MLQIDYLPLDRAREAASRADRRLLGMIGFPRLPEAMPEAMPKASVPTDDLPGGAGRGVCEVWTAHEPVVHSVEGDIRLAVAGNFLFGVASVPETSGGLRATTERAYRDVFATVERAGFPHVARFWNYFARINAEEDGLERYRQFNLGRAAAFAAAGRLGAATIPAACALGTALGDHLTLSFVASRTPGASLENPRQLSAYRYPAEYGPQSPMFSRAVVHPSDDGQILFVSGTASIVGHATRHAGDVVAQTRETLANLRAIFGEADRHVGRAAFPLEEASFKVYVRHCVDVAGVQREIFAALGAGVDAHFIRADICRHDLLVEIEAVAFASLPDAAARLPR